MTEPIEPTGRIKTFTYDPTHHTTTGRIPTIFVYDCSNWLLPAAKGTTFAYEVDGKGSAVFQVVRVHFRVKST